MNSFPFAREISLQNPTNNAFRYGNMHTSRCLSANERRQFARVTTAYHGTEHAF